MRYRTLTKNKEFTRAYTRGKSFVHPLLVLYVVKTRTGQTRVGITSSKKIGNAVTRNRARRVIRAAMQQLLPQNVGSWDLVFVARGKTAQSKSWQLEKVMKKQLEAAGVLQATQAEQPEWFPKGWFFSFASTKNFFHLFWEITVGLFPVVASMPLKQLLFMVLSKVQCWLCGEFCAAIPLEAVGETLCPQKENGSHSCFPFCLSSCSLFS